jgi:hypothetical protein
MILEPGIYPGLPMAEYLAQPCASSSLIQTVIAECPRAAWHRSWLNPKPPAWSSGAAQDAGTIAHSILLEGGSTAMVEVIDPTLYPTRTTGHIPDGWTNKEIRAARDYAIAAGKIPVFPGTMRTIGAMVEAALAFLDSLKQSPDELARAVHAAFQPGGGESELTMVWDDASGVRCRIRPDRASTDRRLLVDYKTGGTTAEPDTWGRTQMVKMGYYVGGAFYRRGVKALCSVTPDYVFFVQEQEAPFLCSLVGIDRIGLDVGARKVARGLATWAACAKSGVWPAYPTSVCYPELPTWELARWENIETNGTPYYIEKMWGEERARIEAEGAGGQGSWADAVARLP